MPPYILCTNIVATRSCSNFRSHGLIQVIHHHHDREPRILGAIDMAKTELLHQLKTQKNPREGAARVPKLRADWRVSVSDRYNPKAHLHHTFQDRLVAMKRCHDKLPGLPPVSIFTTWPPTEGYQYLLNCNWEKPIQQKIESCRSRHYTTRTYFKYNGNERPRCRKDTFHDMYWT